MFGTRDLIFDCAPDSRDVRTESVPLIPHCAECGGVWRPTDRKRWRAYLGVDEHLDEPAEVVILCPRCAEREFGEG